MPSRTELGLQVGVAGVEAPHEPELHDPLAEGDLGVEHGDRLRLVHRERLLAQDGLAGGETVEQLLRVEPVRRGDEHRVRVVGAEDLLDRPDASRAEVRRERRRARRVGVVDDGEP